MLECLDRVCVSSERLLELISAVDQVYVEVSIFDSVRYFLQVGEGELYVLDEFVDHIREHGAGWDVVVSVPVVQSYEASRLYIHLPD